MARPMALFVRKFFLPLLLAAMAMLFQASPAIAADPATEVQTSWRLLDYIAVDYRAAVRGGRIINPAEYQAMETYPASVRERLAAPPAKPARAGLLADADRLRAAIAEKA